MFSHRGLFLAVTISLASIALADILIQPGYEHQYYSNPRYLQHQSVSQPWIRSPTEQYRTEQLPNQESTRYLSGVQTVYPYELNQARSHVLGYPHRPLYHHYLPRRHHVHFARIGGHGYVRPSVYGHVGHPQSLTVPNRRKRSRRSDPTSTESSKSEVVAHDNDVAAKSPLTDAKHPTTIDSLLPEHEPTDTTDKRVENRQIKNDYVTNPHSFDFYTEDTRPEHTYIPNTWESMIHPFYTNRHLQLSNVAQGEACCDDSRIIYNRPLMRFAQSSSSQKSNDDNYSSKYRDNKSDSTSDTVKKTAKWFETLYTSLLNKSQYIRPYQPGHMYSVPYFPQRMTGDYMEEAYYGRAAHHEPEKKSLQEITNMNIINTAEPSQDKTLQDIPFYSEMTPKAYQYADTAATPTSVQSQPPFVTYMQNPYRSNEELSATNEIVGAPYDTNDRPYPNNNFNYLYIYPGYWNNDWGNAEGLEDFFIQLKKKNDTTSTNASKYPFDINTFYAAYGRMLE